MEFGDGLLKAKALDDRVGCAVLVKLLLEELPVDCTFVFTVQEEVGLRGAYGAAFSVKPDYAVVVEGTTAADAPVTARHKRVCAPGRGPVIPIMDGGPFTTRAFRPYDRRRGRNAASVEDKQLHLRRDGWRCHPAQPRGSPDRRRCRGGALSAFSLQRGEHPRLELLYTS